jgi:hypothetical protein
MRPNQRCRAQAPSICAESGSIDFWDAPTSFHGNVVDFEPLARPPLLIPGLYIELSCPETIGKSDVVASRRGFSVMECHSNWEAGLRGIQTWPLPLHPRRPVKPAGTGR